MAAAEINALTEIEVLVEEMKSLGPDMLALAQSLEELLRQFDTEGIAALVRRTTILGK